MCVREREYEYVCVISTLLSPASVVHIYMDEGLTFGVRATCMEALSLKLRPCKLFPYPWWDDNRYGLAGKHFEFMFAIFLSFP